MNSDKNIQFGALKIFAAVADSETLTHAAQKLGITQSAVSQAIAQLESTTECQLVIRRSRPIKLTPSGQVLRQHAIEILASVRRMLGAVQTASGDALPQFSMGLIDSFGDVAAEPLVAALDKLAVQLTLQTGYTGPLSQAFLSHQLDILLTTDPVDEYPDLERHPILRDPFILVVAKAHELECQQNLTHFTAKHDFVRYTRSTRIGKMSDLVARRLKIQKDARYEVDSTRTMLKFVHADHGWAITTGLCIAQHQELLKGVALLPIAQSANARYLSLLARRNELGEVPKEVAAICRTIFDQHILSKILSSAPWLKGEVHSLTEIPVI